MARTTAAGYLDILEETLLCFRLPAYEARLRVRERKLPKWYWCDPGLARVMKRKTAPLAPEKRGALFEGLQRRIVVCPDGPVMKTQDGIDAMPFRRFAEELASDALWK
ncbi:MAG: DUF4143 domain-containing protein [Syntrophales bacterium]|nr:DUF4143 domain-containing protein [Syntrophales bacterium]